MKRIFNISTVSMMAVAISLVAATAWGISTTKRQFEQSVRHDLSVAEWKLAAVFYDGQFSDLIRRAEWLDGQGLGAADAGRMTVEYNTGIAEGKNRFRVLLQGAGDLRKVKEQSSQKGADVISPTLSMLGWLAIGLSTSGCLLLPLLAARNHLTGRKSADESNEAPARALPLSNVAIRGA